VEGIGWRKAMVDQFSGLNLTSSFISRSPPNTHCTFYGVALELALYRYCESGEFDEEETLA
jgi:hypothetical protein